MYLQRAVISVQIMQTNPARKQIVRVRWRTV